MGQTGFCETLRFPAFSAKICGFRRFSAKKLKATIGKNQRQKKAASVRENRRFSRGDNGANATAPFLFRDDQLKSAQ